MLTLLKWPLIIFAVFVAGFGVLAIALSSSSDGSPAPVKLDLASIRRLSDAAEQDADNMERHAQTMVTLAATRPDHAHWASDAELARASARSLRFLAESARAIDRDQAAFPASASAIQLDRLQGDGLNLQGLGSTLIEHGNAMEKHGDVMRQEAGNVLPLSQR